MSENRKTPQIGPRHKAESSGLSRRDMLKMLAIGATSAVVTREAMDRGRQAASVNPPEASSPDQTPNTLPTPETPSMPEQTLEEAQAQAAQYTDMLNRTIADGSTVPLPTMPGALVWRDTTYTDGEVDNVCLYPIYLDTPPLDSDSGPVPEELDGRGNFISVSYQPAASTDTRGMTPPFIGYQTGQAGGIVKIEALDTRNLQNLVFVPDAPSPALHGGDNVAVFDARVDPETSLVIVPGPDGQRLTNDVGDYILPGFFEGNK